MSEEQIGILLTERLVIRPLTEEEFLRALHAEQAACAAALENGGEAPQAVLAELWERYRENKKNRFSFFTNRILQKKDDGAAVGSIAFMSDPETDEEGLLEIGYETLFPYRGQGYATEALGAMCRAGLSLCACRGMIAGVELSNPASARVLEKCGFVCTDRSERLGLAIYRREKGEKGEKGEKEKRC